MTEFARQLKAFLDKYVESDMTVEELTELFFKTHTMPTIATQADLDREVDAVNTLINEANFQDVMSKLGL